MKACILQLSYDAMQFSGYEIHNDFMQMNMNSYHFRNNCSWYQYISVTDKVFS